MRFMQGRRGLDQLGVFLFIAGFVVELAGNLFRVRLIYYIGLAMFFFGIYRMFSRNIYKREEENERFLRFKARFTDRRAGAGGWPGRSAGNAGGDRGGWNSGNANGNGGAGPAGPDKTVYCVYYCPSCQQQVRIPAGKGRVRVTCPVCKEKFEIIT